MLQASKKTGLVAAARRMLRSYRIFALDQGHWRSVRQQAAVAADGSPIPWYTYASIEFLRGFDFSRSDVFEFGAGNSSLFWAARARKVTSVEDNRDWHAQVASRAGPNQEVLLCTTEGEYVQSLTLAKQLFHVIVVDGKWRRKCVELALSYVHEDGIILLDNSDRYPLACEFVRSRGFFQIDFSGPGPINSYSWTTSIFVRSQSKLQNGYKQPSVIGGLNTCTDQYEPRLELI